MKTLKQFLEEALTHPYEFSKRESRLASDGSDGRFHSYTFKDHKDRPFFVDVYHNPETPKKAEVAFEDQYGMGKTGQSGKHAVRIFSTVKAIMKKHAKDHPHLNSYEFTAIKTGYHDKEDSKARLYKTLANTHGGSKTGEDEYFHKFEVPIKREK